MICEFGFMRSAMFPFFHLRGIPPSPTDGWYFRELCCVKMGVMVCLRLFLVVFRSQKSPFLAALKNESGAGVGPHRAPVDTRAPILLVADPSGANISTETEKYRGKCIRRLEASVCRNSNLSRDSF